MMNLTDLESEALDSDLSALNRAEALTPPDHYRTMVLEYCRLAIKPTLTEPEQDRMAEILDMGTEDAVLNFWLEEGDHLVAHHLGLIDEDFIHNQQDKFRRAIGQSWIDTLWRDLQSSTKVLQAYLHCQGVYQGSIDGVMGPSTQAAVRQLLEKQPNALVGLGLT
jgi:hypothetical protein